jgi:hypothetical protein
VTQQQCKGREMQVGGWLGKRWSQQPKWCVHGHEVCRRVHPVKALEAMLSKESSDLLYR